MEKDTKAAEELANKENEEAIRLKEDKEAKKKLAQEKIKKA